MKNITRHLITGASVLALSVTAYAQSSSTSLKKDDAKAEAGKFSGAFTIGLGQDSNIGDTKDGTSGSFVEIKPSLNYTSGIFSTDLSAGIKDYSDQQISSNAQESSAEIAFGLNTKIFGNTDSSTKLSLSYSDGRIPDYNNGANSVTEGVGADNRSVSTGISQSLAWDFKKLNISAEGSYVSQDYTTNVVDGNNLFGEQDVQKDNNKLEGKTRVGIKMSDNVELAATPLISHQKYSERQARESNGARIGNQGIGVGTGKQTEYVVNEMTAELIISAGALSVTPKLVSGLQIDQANGGEDYRYNETGLSTSVLVNKANNVSLNASYSVKNENFDNYTAGVPGGETREDDIEAVTVGTSFNVSNSVSLAVDYSNTLETSNHPSQDFNFRQEVFSTGLTVSF